MTKLLIKIDLNTKSLLESCKDSLKIIKIPNSFNLIIENDSLNQCLNLKILDFYEKVNLGYFNRNEIGWNKDNLPLDFFPISLTSLSLGSSFNKPLLLNSLPNGLLVLKFNQDSRFNHPIEVGVLPVTLITLEFGYAFSFKITDPNILPKSLQYLVLPSETSSISKDATPKSSGGAIEGITINEPFSRLWGSINSKICARDVFSPVEDCSFPISDLPIYPKPSNLKYSKKPKTTGEIIVITGSYLRFMGGPNFLLFNKYPSFDCNNFTVIFPPGFGSFRLYFDETGLYPVPFSYESPKISSIVSDSLKQIITINGDNFFINENLIRVSFDGINQTNFIISVNHKQILVNNVNRADPGPMSVYIDVNGIQIENNYIHCFPAIITSISSVSNHLGGIVTIKGEKLSSTLNSSLTPSITIGDKQCTFIKSTTTELECQLGPNGVGGKNLPVNVNFGGCNSTSPNGVTFTYNIPTLSSGSYSIGIVTSIGTNLGTNKESSIQLYGDGINNTNITQFNVSSDEKSITFELPYLRCRSFNINFTRSNIPANTLSISALLLINVTNRPTVSNGTLNIEFYYMDCQNISSFYQTTCPTPYGTGINKQFLFKLNPVIFSEEFSYAPPKVENRKISYGTPNITFHGNNFSNSTSLIQVYLNGIDISSEIIEVKDDHFIIKRLDSFENGPINITVDGNNMESVFNLILPPVIYGIINKDKKALACRGLITVSGKNLLTIDNEFKVKVLANNKNTTVIALNENTLIVRAHSMESPLFVSTFIGDKLGPNSTLTYLDPKFTVITSVFKKKDGISTIVAGISLQNTYYVALGVKSKNVSFSCNLQCSSSPSETFYYSNYNSKSSSSEADITNSTDLISCYSDSIVEETSGQLHLQLGSTSFRYDVKIEEIQLSPSPSIKPSMLLLLVLSLVLLIILK
ncbi:hypothetical protein ACTFIW_010627 [Dictyostelium discoideum]